MLNLQAAKCPQCNANIEVDKSLEQTICPYCGTQILVSEAIQKIELSGNVKVAGIKNRDDYISQAKKHFEVGEYEEAKECLDYIFVDDDFDIEAYCELIKIDLELLKEQNFDIYMSPDNTYYNKDIEPLYTEYLNTYARVLKIDKNNERFTYLGDYINIINEYENKINRVEELQIKNKGIIDRLNQDYQKVHECNTDLWTEYEDLLNNCFLTGVITKTPLIKEFKRLTIDGLLSIEYNDNSTTKKSIFPEQIQNYEEEINKKYQDYLSKIDNILNNLNINQEARIRQDAQDREEERIRNYTKHSNYIYICWGVLGGFLSIDVIISLLTKLTNGQIDYLYLVIFLTMEAYPTVVTIKKLFSNISERKKYVKNTSNTIN